MNYISRALVITCVSIAVIASSSSTSFAKKSGKCTTAAKVTQDIWAKWGKTVTKLMKASGEPTLQTVARSAEAADKMIKWWNANVAKNSWAKIGPRRLNFKGTNKGTIPSKGTRVWVSSRPSNANHVKLKMKKIGGKAKTNVYVCAVDKNNKAKLLKEFTFKKGKKKRSVEVVVSGMPGKILQIVLKGKSVAKKMKYSFTLQGKFSIRDKKWSADSL